MNRAMRRKAGITEKPVTYTLTQQELIKVIKKEMEPEIDAAKREALSFAVERVTAVMLMSLRGVFKFGHDRTVKLLKKAQEMYTAADDKDMLDFDHIIQACNDELGVQIGKGVTFMAISGPALKCKQAYFDGDNRFAQKIYCKLSGCFCMHTAWQDGCFMQRENVTSCPKFEAAGVDNNEG